MIGYVTVDELHEPRLYINMKLSFRPRSYREMRVFLLLNTESRFCSFSSPTITYSVKIWRSSSVSWNDAYPPAPLCLFRLIFSLNLADDTRWLSSKQFYVRQSLNLWTNAFSSAPGWSSASFWMARKTIGKKPGCQNQHKIWFRDSL